MTRRSISCALLLAAVYVVSGAPVLRADVKTTEKNTFKLEGLLGAFLNRAAGGADGMTTSIAVKGNRMARINTENGQGQIVDLAEEKIYTVDTKKKEYSVLTFAEVRAQMEKMKADMAKQQQQATPEQKQAMQDLAKQFETDVDVKSTGQTKMVAGQTARESVLTITMRQAGKKLEEGGGFVLTSNIWLGPKNAALDEVTEFSIKYVKAVYGEMFTGLDMSQMGPLSALMPGTGTLMAKMAEEGRKLQGTPLASTTIIESVKSAEQMAAAAAQQPSSGGGLGGAIAARMMRGRGSMQPRTTALTTGREVLSIASAASAEDVAIPATFKLKK